MAQPLLLYWLQCASDSGWLNSLYVPLLGRCPMVWESPTLCYRHLQHCGRGITNIVVQVSPTLWYRHLQHCGTGISNIVVWASPTLWYGHCQHCDTGISNIVVQALPTLWCLHHDPGFNIITALPDLSGTPTLPHIA